MVSFKICPICGTRAHRSAAVCATCGASLHDVPETTAKSLRAQPSTSSPDLDRRYGEVDLLEREVSRRGRLLSGILFGIVAIVLAALAIPLIGRLAQSDNDPAMMTVSAPVLSPSITVVLETNTPMPTPVMATVTQRPPTATATETPGPCTHVVQPGDDLISIVFNCGHRSLDVMPSVLELNDLSAAELIQQGQEILVPWPTPTIDPEAAADVAAVPDEAAGNSLEVAFLPFALDPLAANDPEDENDLASFATQTPFVIPTETMIPGVGYHTVQAGESMVSIAYQYQTNAETLSQLNPDIAFSQCDFGLDTGGPTCTVLIAIGQQVRVPVPTPTPSHTPTLTGSETPTPLPTATFNAPSLISPANRVFFLRNDLITLRWVGTGVLGDDETYIVIMKDLTANQTFEEQTRDLFFIVPTDWQSSDAVPHDYQWSIGVIQVVDPNNPRYVTDPRLFTWEGRGETS